MVKFFETLQEFISYDEEVFPCELVVSSNIVFGILRKKGSLSLNIMIVIDIVMKCRRCKLFCCLLLQTQPLS